MNCAECMEPAVARSLCHRHYQMYRWRKEHNPDTWTGWPYERELRRQAKGIRCDYCTSPAYARGMCRNHYRWYARRGMLELMTP